MEGYDLVLFQGGGNRGGLSHGLFGYQMSVMSALAHSVYTTRHSGKPQAVKRKRISLKSQRLQRCSVNSVFDLFA
jgi:hypothetical protein